MVETVQVSKTLTVDLQTGADAHLAIDRAQGGLVRIEAGEVRHLVAALAEAAGLLAEQEAQRARSSSRAVVEARRLRRRRVGEADR